MTAQPGVKICKGCDRIYRADRSCPNCLRLRLRNERKEAAKPRIGRKLAFVDYLEYHPEALRWLISSGHLPSIEAAWANNTQLRARLNKYDLTPAKWAQMVVKLQSSCQICRKPEHPLKLNIDHDHITGHIRGLLCTPCNTGIGMLRIDGPEGHKRAASVRAYIAQISHFRQAH